MLTITCANTYLKLLQATKDHAQKKMPKSAKQNKTIQFLYT
jgi:hypothetical protein